MQLFFYWLNNGHFMYTIAEGVSYILFYITI